MNAEQLALHRIKPFNMDIIAFVSLEPAEFPCPARIWLGGETLSDDRLLEAEFDDDALMQWVDAGQY
jgi:hypothetical protein